VQQTTTVATYAIGDPYLLKAALPARFNNTSTYVAAPEICAGCPGPSGMLCLFARSPLRRVSGHVGETRMLEPSSFARLLVILRKDLQRRRSTDTYRTKQLSTLVRTIGKDDRIPSRYGMS
jgi:hypothetical protein